MKKIEQKSDSDLAKDFHSVWHPCTQMKDHETMPPLMIERGDGVYLFDADGNKYLDVISSWWVNLFGHNHPRLNSALKAQLGKVAHVMFAGITHKPAIDLAERLVELSPDNLQKVFFSDNGSTAVEVAVKMSLQYWRQTGYPDKRKFAYLKDGYHGETLGALSLCGIDMFRENFNEILMDNIEVQGPDCYHCPYGMKPETCDAECFAPMQKTLADHRESLAGVIIEPLVQGAAGMKMYPPVYLKKLQSACESHNVHTIYDEIAVGFGRTGALFVCGEYDLSPTFLCLSKGITSGYLPLAVTLTEDAVYKAFYDDFAAMKFFIHSHSYSANPLACAVANESLTMLTENGFLESLQPKIQAMEEHGKRFKELNWVGEFRQTGMIAAVELVKDRETKEPFPFKARVGYKIYQEGLKRGVLMRPLGNVIYFIPPLVISIEEIKTMIDTAIDCIRAVLD